MRVSHDSALPVLVASLALLAAPLTARAGTPMYDCSDSMSCGAPCVLEDASCYQPVECQLLTEDDPIYDGCSLPDEAINGLLFLDPAQAIFFALWRDRFGTSDFNDSPCLRHDQCYLQGSLTYGLSRHDCDLDFRDDMVAHCKEEIPAWNFVARATCARMAATFYAGVDVGGGARWQEKQTTCCDYESNPDAMTPICAGAYAHQPDPNAPPPVPEECIGLEGQCAGAECLPVDPGANDFGELIDPWSPYHPNGDFGPGFRCDTDVNTNARLVCNEVGGVGRCQACNVDTTLGCPCSENDDCSGGQTCRGGISEGWVGGVGRCWPINDVPSWQCAESCEVLSDRHGNESYYCEHNLLPDGAACSPADHGLPPVETCWPLVPISGGACADQCVSKDHCEAHGWPVGVQCSGGRCVL